MPRDKFPLRAILRQLVYWPDLIRFRRLASRLHQEFGLPRIGIRDVLKNQADLNIIFTSREYLPCSERLDSSYRFVGASISDRASDVLPLPNRGDRPVVYISLGTMFNQCADFYKNCLAAFQNEEVFVVISVGGKTDLSSLGTLPENAYVAASVPQLDVLRQASVFISQGGGCSVNESLVHGVPLIMWPQHFDHMFNADCVVALGAGVRLGTEDITPERLRSETLRVLREPGYHEAAKRIGATLIDAGGARRAAEEILSFQRSRANVRSSEKPLDTARSSIDSPVTVI